VQIHIEGLKGTEYLDSLDGRKRKSEVDDVLLFNGEVDRIYTDVPGNVQVTSGIPSLQLPDPRMCT
jgi:D-hexose-6-phosphate mutarotase